MAGAPILPLVAQDPWFGGGAQAMLQAFIRGARDVGRLPVVHYVSHARSLSVARRSFALAAVRDGEGAVAYPAFLPELDTLNQTVAGVRIGSALRGGPDPWVVAAAASHGLAAPLSGARYACWIATALEDEWASRRAGLSRARRTALALNAPALLRLERRVLRMAARVYTISPASAVALAATAELPAAAVTVLPIPVDVEGLRPEPDEEWRSTLDRPVVVFVGRARDPRKNLSLLLEAFSVLRERRPTAVLRLAGEAPASLPSGLPAGSVEVLGHVRSLTEAFKGATLLALPSLQEGFGIVAAEALAAGLPVVATPCGGPEHLLRASGGGLVLSGFSTDELADALDRLLEDVPRLEELRRAGRGYVIQEHSPTRFREGLARALAEVEGHA